MNMNNIYRKIHLLGTRSLNRIIFNQICNSVAHRSCLTVEKKIFFRMSFHHRSNVTGVSYSTNGALQLSMQGSLEDSDDQDKLLVDDITENIPVGKRMTSAHQKYILFKKKALTETNMNSSEASNFLVYIKNMTQNVQPTESSEKTFQKLHNIVKDWCEEKYLSTKTLKLRLDLLEEIGCTAEQIIECPDILIEISTDDIMRCNKRLKELNIDKVSVVLLQIIFSSDSHFVKRHISYLQQVFCGKCTIRSIIKTNLNLSSMDVILLDRYVTLFIKRLTPLVYFLRCVNKLEFLNLEQYDMISLAEIILKHPRATFKRTVELEELGMLNSNGQFLHCSTLLAMKKKRYSEYKAEVQKEMMGQCKSTKEWVEARLGGKMVDEVTFNSKKSFYVLRIETRIKYLLENGISAQAILQNPQCLKFKLSSLKNKLESDPQESMEDRFEAFSNNNSRLHVESLCRVLETPKALLKKHPYPLMKPVCYLKKDVLRKNFKYLRELNFTVEDIANCPMILLHDKEILEEHLAVVNSEKYAHFNSSQRLNLIQYYIELKHGWLH